MSVIYKTNHENKYYVISKGSPKKIKEICKKETIPNEF